MFDELSEALEEYFSPAPSVIEERFNFYVITDSFFFFSSKLLSEIKGIMPEIILTLNMLIRKFLTFFN